MRIVDAHCHLQSERFDGIRDDVVERAVRSGVVRMINAATSRNDWSACRDLSLKYPVCDFALGVHPWYIDAASDYLKDEGIEGLFAGASAVGEIGLDKKNGAPFDIQILVFRKYLEYARELNLPVVLHCVAAFSEVEAELKRCPVKRGAVIHNFNGSSELAEQLSGQGVFFSIGGTLTYRDSLKRQQMLKKIFPERFLLETDSPDLPPAERRGTVNEPSNIRFNLAAASELLGISEEIIGERTTENAEIIFGISRA